MRFLVTGAAGQVGFELQRSLSLLGEVVALTSAQLDLCDAAAIAATVERMQPDWIINAAAYTAVDKAESETEKAYAVNALAPGALAQSARKVGAGFIHYSTDYVFDGTGNTPWQETDTPAPLNAYGRSKLEGEQRIAKALADWDGHWYILRTSWVFGAYGQNFVKTMLRLAQQRESLSVVADQVGAPTSAALLADIAARLVDKRPASGVYHAAAAGETSWHGFAQHVLRRAASKGLKLNLDPEQIAAIATEQYPTPALRPKNSRLDCRKLAQALGVPALPNWQLAADQVTDIMVTNTGV